LTRVWVKSIDNCSRELELFAIALAALVQTVTHYNFVNIFHEVSELKGLTMISPRRPYWLRWVESS
jgi:hypothetical protein